MGVAVLGGSQMDSAQQPAPGAPAPVVRLPHEIDAGTAWRVQDELAQTIAGGAPIVIADMRATRFCDSAGAHALVMAHHQATANQSELRLVVTSAAVRRFFGMAKLDTLLAVYPTLIAALRADVPPGPPPAHQPRRDPLSQPGRARLRARVEAMPVIEQAKGIIIAQTGCDPGEASQRLRQAAQRLNRPLQDLAADIVASMQRRGPGGAAAPGPVAGLGQVNPGLPEGGA